MPLARCRNSKRIKDGGALGRRSSRVCGSAAAGICHTQHEPIEPRYMPIASVPIKTSDDHNGDPTVCVCVSGSVSCVWWWWWRVSIAVRALTLVECGTGVPTRRPFPFFLDIFLDRFFRAILAGPCHFNGGRSLSPPPSRTHTHTHTHTHTFH